MKLTIDRQFRFVDFNIPIKKDIFVGKLKNTNNLIHINETSLVIWNYKGTLKNERVFNGMIELDGIIILFDYDTREYISFKNNKPFDHVMFNEIIHWVKIKHDNNGKRLLYKMRDFREAFLDYRLNYKFYRGVHSDLFAVIREDGEFYLSNWNENNNKRKLSVDENFSFFLKLCKLIL